MASLGKNLNLGQGHDRTGTALAVVATTVSGVYICWPAEFTIHTIWLCMCIYIYIYI